MAQLTLADNEDALAALAAERITELIAEAVADRGAAFVALSGGGTPRHLYSELADVRQPWRERIPWPQVHLFWGDERHVPPDHPDSNYGTARAALLDHVPVPPDHVHRIRGEMPDAREAASDYERELAATASAGRRNEPFFDVMLLGLGEDAHIASIFPGSVLLQHANDRRVAAVWAPQLTVWRITLTPEAVLDSRAIIVLVAGAHKAAAVNAAVDGPLDVKAYPAQLLRQADQRVTWLLDRAAASRL